jgi:hypothetical protein
MPRRILLVVAIVLCVSSSRPSGAELKPRTVAAFDRYVRVTEARMTGDAPFLWVDALQEAKRRSSLETMRQGQLVIERLQTHDAGKAIDIPDGMVHHWLGSVFVPGATVGQAVTLLQDYDRHAEIYRPNVVQSRLLSRDGDLFRAYLRFYMKKVIAVTVNSEHEALFTRPAADRAQSRIYSMRIAEVENAGTAHEREKPVGNDGGFLWRLNTYWRFLERDGGTYLQCEAISLSRGIPLGVGWLVGPFVTSIPRDSLTFTLETSRATLARQVGTQPAPSPAQ